VKFERASSTHGVQHGAGSLAASALLSPRESSAISGDAAQKLGYSRR
jgi:hypothetical protein